MRANQEEAFHAPKRPERGGTRVYRRAGHRDLAFADDPSPVPDTTSAPTDSGEQAAETGPSPVPSDRGAAEATPAPAEERDGVSVVPRGAGHR